MSYVEYIILQHNISNHVIFVNFRLYIFKVIHWHSSISVSFYLHFGCFASALKTTSKLDFVTVQVNWICLWFPAFFSETRNFYGLHPIFLIQQNLFTFSRSFIDILVFLDPYQLSIIISLFQNIWEKKSFVFPLIQVWVSIFF
jgi:hypothetical protein